MGRTGIIVDFGLLDAVREANRIEYPDNSQVIAPSCDNFHFRKAQATIKVTKMD